MENTITFEPVGGDLYNVAYRKEPSEIRDNIAIDRLEIICDREPYNFEAALELARRYAEKGDHDRACQVRFHAASEAVNALDDEDEYFELDWENPENQEFIEIITSSGTDFYMHGDFEMAAALFETALSLDSQDHVDVTPQLAFSYIAIDDWEGYESLKNDLGQGSMIEALVESFAAYRRGVELTKELPMELVREIKAEEHDIDDDFIAQADKERVTKSVAARELWYRHMPVFEVFPEFKRCLS